MILVKQINQYGNTVQDNIKYAKHVMIKQIVKDVLYAEMIQQLFHKKLNLKTDKQTEHY